MATKYFCDGCDRELPATKVMHIDVLVVVGAHQNRTPEEYELCESCASHLKDQANPKRWARCKTAAA